ncbi:patched domain-containing protein 3-like [Sceloporus undulatus]|uniref:patched domain-containing protein 3-like n=1 Tax=Sceloporus undulatus TaxID=8520 RepID=UPI001C4DC954|nr:patched domain-containing protein 3-like [Sceloporus undulatus]
MPERGWHTDCVERPLSGLLRVLGSWVGAQPWPFLLLPLGLAGLLGCGLVFVPERETNDLETQFTPVDGPAKAERRFVQEHFPTDDGQAFSGQRLATLGTYATLLAVAADQESLLTGAALAEVLALDKAVRGIRSDGQAFTDLCARQRGACAQPNPLLPWLRGDPRRLQALLPNLTFPLFQGSLFLGFALGGVTLGPGQEPARPVRAARALRLLYFLQEDRDDLRLASRRWLQTFLDTIPALLGSLKLASVRVAYFTSISRQKEFEKLAKDVIPLVSAAYLLTILFSILSCSRLDNVRTKVWVAIFGVMSSGLSVVSSFGLLLFCGVPFVITAANSPFLILGIGIDDMFILVSCWQRTQVKESIKDRMADTYAEAAMSVTITSLTNVLAFYIGIATSFPSVQSFCIYTGTAFIFCFIYNLTFLGAVLALNGKREESNRHWLTFRKVELHDSQGSLYRMCCTGGSFNESTGTEYEHPMNQFFKKHYGPFFMNRWVKIFVVILYAIYLTSSIIGCIHVEEGIDLRNVATDDSYLIPYYDFEDEHFTRYGPRVMVVVTDSVEYWDPSVRENIENCMKALESSRFVDKTLSESWLRIYQTVAKHMSLDINNRNVFIGNLSALFTLNPDYKWDINLKPTEILASRFFIQTIHVASAVDEKNLLNELRAFAADCKVPMIINHPAFVHFDQFLVIIQNTIQNVLIATGAMLLISLLLIPNPLCSLWVTFAIVSVIIGVSGFMSFWGINLDSISMINLVICIGFSVDYSAHISYAFVSSEKPTVNEKAVDALYRLGYPILQAAFSTLVGVFVLSQASTYVFRTSFKIIFLVIMFGLAHGIIFIPVFLTLFKSCG